MSTDAEENAENSVNIPAFVAGSESGSMAVDKKRARHFADLSDQTNLSDLSDLSSLLVDSYRQLSTMISPPDGFGKGEEKINKRGQAFCGLVGSDRS